MAFQNSLVEKWYRNSPNLFHTWLRTGSGIDNFFTFALVFIIVFQIYKSYSNKRYNRLNKTSNSGKITSGHLGYHDLPAIKPWIPLKLIGNVPQVLPLANFLKVIEQWSQKYGDIFTATGLNQQFVILNSGPLIQALFKSSDFGHVAKSPTFYNPMQPFITNGVLVSNGILWKRQRKLLLQSQTFQNLKAYISMLNRHSQNLVHNLETLFEDKCPHEINSSINTAFLGVISEMITGRDLSGSDELDQYHRNFNIWKETLVHRVINPLFHFYPFRMFHPGVEKCELATKDLIGFAQRRIHEHREARKLVTVVAEQFDGTDNITTHEKPMFRSILDELIDAGVDDSQIVDEVNTMMFGGHETGATAIHFLCLSLALNQHVQELARMEVDETFDQLTRNNENMVTYEAVQTRLKYVERCILETLRLFPPAFLLARRLEMPLQFEYNNKHVILPTGITVFVAPILIHKRAKYFSDPEKFDPDRFLPEESAKRHQYSYIPFSMGPRNCIGQKFAMIEMKIVTAYLLRHFEIKTTDKAEDIPLLPHTTLTPAKDYTFQLTRRTKY